MIFYFSATGNSKYVAKRAAEALHETMVPIVECARNEAHEFFLTEGECVGIVTPTYAFRLPHIVEHFLKGLVIDGSEGHYIFLISTYGTTPGITGELAREILAKRGITLSAAYSVRMPDTWTPTFDLSNPIHVQEINAQAEEDIRAALDAISAREEGNHQSRKVPMVVRGATVRAYEKMRRTSHFSVDDTCVHCGLCERRCPARAIRIKNGRPVWIREKCEACLGCLHHCPKFAIQYGRRTRHHGQYRNPHV